MAINKNEYPEFDKLIQKIADAVAIEINDKAPKIKTKLTEHLKCQYVLESVIQELETRV